MTMNSDGPRHLDIDCRVILGHGERNGTAQTFERDLSGRRPTPVFCGPGRWYGELPTTLFERCLRCCRENKCPQRRSGYDSHSFSDCQKPIRVLLVLLPVQRGCPASRISICGVCLEGQVRRTRWLPSATQES